MSNTDSKRGIENPIGSSDSPKKVFAMHTEADHLCAKIKELESKIDNLEQEKATLMAQLSDANKTIAQLKSNQHLSGSVVYKY